MKGLMERIVNLLRKRKWFMMYPQAASPTGFESQFYNFQVV